MGCNKLIRLAFQKFGRRKFHATAERYCSNNWRGVIREELEGGNPKESEFVCIYRIPPNMLRVQRRAYVPNNISIGPYHHGIPHLKDMEVLKMKFFRRLFDPNGPNGAKLDEAFNTLEGLQDKARQCYMEEVKLSSDEFLHMMLVDASFIIQLLRDLSENGFKKAPLHLSRWMLPTIRREMIMLENQIPLFVLTKIFELTENKSTSTHECMSLDALVLRFFYPLLKSGSSNIPKSVKAEFRLQHLLDLLRSSIRPRIGGKEPRGTQTNMIHSITELMEAGVKIKADDSKQLLNIRFGTKWGEFVKELTVPTLHISDHRGTVFRNIVAFEKCHKRCYPDVTTYIFFFNRLINSADDVALLHYKGVLNHTLGNDQLVADLINNIAKEIVPDMDESYLYKVVNEANEYFGTRYAKVRSSIVHYYLTSWVVGVSTVGAILALYFTFLQTICGFADSDSRHSFKAFTGKSFSSIIKEALGLPFRPTSSAYDTESKTSS